MLISYCIPIRNRLDDLRKALPAVLEAARKSLPVEVIILDYGSTDNLVQYLQSVNAPEVKYYFYKAPYFHMAHARNLAMLAGEGTYLVSTNADTMLNSLYFTTIRNIIEKTNCDLVLAEGIYGVIVVKREEFIKAGGFDERFEFYGPEDKDLVNRLIRRGLQIKFYNSHFIYNIPTSNAKKSTGYRLQISKWAMKRLMHPIFDENEANGSLIANESGWIGSSKKG